MKGEASMKISFGFLLLLLGSALPSPVPEAKETNEHLLYPYGTAEGDMKNPKDDDGTSPRLLIDEDFTFFGKTYRDIYVCNNGVISFGVPVPEYTPEAIPLANGKRFVAPYWGDVNNLLGGEIFYREVKNKKKDIELLRQLTRDINKYFPDIPFTATWAFIATWDHVAFYGALSKKTNTFQAILITNGKTSFVMLNFGQIQWTTGAASGGDRMTGLNGTPAQSGFNGGDKKNYFSIPGSRTPEIINITKTSNVHVPGRWVFQVDDFKVTGIPKELLPPAKEEEKANSNEGQGPPSNESNDSEQATEVEESHIVQSNEVNSEVQGQEEKEETEPIPSGNLHEEEQSQVSQDNGVNPGTEEQEEKEEIEPIPSGNLQEQEQSQVSQDTEVSPEAEEQEKKEEVEPVPSGNLREDEQSQVSQDTEVSPEAEEQEEKEEVEPVPSGNLREDEQSQVSQDTEVSPESKEQEKEEMEPVPSENLHEDEQSQVNQSYENPEEEESQKKEENEGVSTVDVPEPPVQKPLLVTEEDDDGDDDSSSEETDDDDCEW